MEVRDSKASVAADRLTCFGGKREKNEIPLDCIKRECFEELNWHVDHPVRAVDLYVNGVLTAWFYEATAPLDPSQLQFEEVIQSIPKIMTEILLSYISCLF